MKRAKAAKADKTGRSTCQKDPRQGPAVWEGHWTSLGSELLESHAWRAQSDNCRKVIDRVIVEHIGHGALSNGALAVTHGDFHLYGIRRSSVLAAIEEAIALGLLRRVRAGHRAWGAFKGRAAVYALTWFATHSGQAPTNEWKRFETIEDASQAAKQARDRVKATACDRPARRKRIVPERAVA